MKTESIKFLVVDDTPQNVVALEALLRRDGLEILQARSGSEALDLLLVHEVALALIDVQMPGMNGFELAELMRSVERTRNVPIIFVTAGVRDPLRVFKGYESGAVDFLFKPIEPHVLKGKADVFFELYRQRQELTEALRLNELFVGIVGHDLRTPLGTMLLGAQQLQAHLTDEFALRVLGRMTASGQRMADMIEQLLDLTRARWADGLGFLRSRSALDVASLVNRTVDELRGAHPARDVDVEIQGDCTSSGDPERLLQLFSNLIANALHHGEAGSVVTVAVSGMEREIVICVRNRGVIPADVLPTLFDPFRGKKTTSSQSRGLGLGMFIAQQIALAHGGRVAVESSEETGTVVTARLERRAVDSKHSSIGATPKTVLIVDDDASIRDSLREAFDELGYAVETAPNGGEALERLTAEPSRFDVVILDLVLPVLDGGEVYQSMQANPALARIPVIVSTSNPAQAPAGLIVVRKPLKLNRLLDTVAALWSKRDANADEELR